MITFVSGFGRCGSSLLCQMLNAGGMIVAGRYPMWEDDRATRSLPYETGWLQGFDRCVVKLLDPLRYLPQERLAYDTQFIWLDRDLEQQANSLMKYLYRHKAQVEQVKRQTPNLQEQERTPEEIVKWWEAQRHLQIEAMIRQTDRPVLNLCFETLITQPKLAAEYVCRYIPEELDVDAMIACVIKREPTMYEGLLEDALHAAQRAKLLL